MSMGQRYEDSTDHKNCRHDRDVNDETEVKEILKAQAELNDEEMEDYITEVRKEYA